VYLQFPALHARTIASLIRLSIVVPILAALARVFLIAARLVFVPVGIGGAGDGAVWHVSEPRGGLPPVSMMVRCASHRDLRGTVAG
jgi:hypothetical protein